MLVERHHLGVGLAAHEADQPVAVDERRAGHTPRRHFGVEVGGKVLLPPHGPVNHVQGQQPAHRPEHVNPVAVDGRGGPRPDGVHQLQPGVVGAPLAGPEHLPGLLVEGEGPLDHRRRPRVGAPGIGDEHAPSGNRGAGIAAVDGRAPSHRQTAVGKSLDEAGLGQDTPAARPAPFGPIVGPSRSGAAGGDQQRQELQDVTRHLHSFRGWTRGVYRLRDSAPRNGAESREACRAAGGAAAGGSGLRSAQTGTAGPGRSSESG